MASQRKRTIRLYRIADDGRRLLAGTIEAGSPAELVALWRAFLATAAPQRLRTLADGRRVISGRSPDQSRSVWKVRWALPTARSITSATTALAVGI